MALSIARLLRRRSGLVVISSFSLLLGAIGPVEADSITYTTHLDSKFQDGYFPLFDPSYGTLYEVDFRPTGEGGALVAFSPYVTITNGTFTATFVFALFTPGNVLMVGPSVETSSFSTSIPGLVDLSGSGSGSASYTGDLSYFELKNGYPTQFNVQIATDFSITSPTLDSQRVVDDFGASGSATLTFFFTPAVSSAIPEPSSLVLAGTGFAAALGLVSWLKRRWRRAA
jgi:hypothetical protein